MKSLLLYLFFIPSLVHSQKIIWDGCKHQLSIGDKIEIYEDKSGILSINNITSNKYKNQFKPSENLILSLGYTDSFFWLRFTVYNQSYEDIILELAQAGLPITELYLTLNDSITQYSKAGYTIPIEDKLIHNSYQAFKLPPGKNLCYLKLNSNSEPIPINIYSPKTFEAQSSKKKISYGLYLGLMIFVILNNIFLFISLHKRLYLFYALIVLMYICYSAAVIDGFLVYFVSKPNLKFLYTTIPAIGITLQTIYCLVFLEVKKYDPKVHKIVLAFIIYFSFWMLIKFFFAFPIVQPINTINALISFLIMSVVGLRVGSKGNKLGYYFASAYFVYFILVAIQAIYINTGSPEYIGGLSFVAYATLVEAFLLSFLLTKRFEWEKEEIEKERYAAQLKVIEKTLENEKIIEEQKSELEKQVEVRTAELKEMNNELTTANKRMLELNDYKESMTAMIVHDFKNLLNTVISFSKSTPTERRLQSIHNAGRYMHNLVMNILDVQKFESVEITLAESNHTISEVVHEAMEQMSFMAEQKSIKLTYQSSEELHSRYDYELILRVIVNILSNAIKYVPVNGKIKIKAERKNKFLMLSISDNGSGIPQDKIDLVFDKYTQINARKSGAVRSTGIGLAFCKMAIEAHDGQIGVESTINKGSTFFFTLPILNSQADKFTSNTKHFHHQEDNIVDLSTDEINILDPFLEELRQWEVYDFSEIKSITNRISAIDNENIIAWNNNLLKVLYNGNAKLYRKIVKHVE